MNSPTKPVNAPLLPELCRQLRAAGVRVQMDPNRTGRCFAHPPAKLTPDMLAGLKKYKLELLSALKRRGAPMLLQPCPCVRCGSDVVFAEGDYCPSCTHLKGRTVVMEPNSEQERELLAAIKNTHENPIELSQTVPSDRTEQSGHSRDSWDSNSGNRGTYAHAKKKMGNS